MRVPASTETPLTGRREAAGRFAKHAPARATRPIPGHSSLRQLASGVRRASTDSNLYFNLFNIVDGRRSSRWQFVFVITHYRYEDGRGDCALSANKTKTRSTQIHFITVMSSNRVCKFYLQGFCSFGNRCWYSHDLSAVGATSLTSEERSTQRRPNQHRKQSNMLNTTSKSRQVKKTRNLSGQATTTTTGKSSEDLENTIQSSSGEAKHDQTDNIDNNPLKTVQKAFENDLQCQICYEIFIKPIVLNCTHTFCETCIHIWTKRVNRCPVCRMNIKSKSHCLTLNVFIEKLVDLMPKDVILRRNLSIEERKKDTEEINSQRNLLNRNNNRTGGDGVIRTLDYFSENRDEDIDTDVNIQEVDMYRMNLHDTVVSTGGLNPLIRYMIPVGEHRI